MGIKCIDQTQKLKFSKEQHIYTYLLGTSRFKKAYEQIPQIILQRPA